jgi:hypothetical protein
MAPRPRLRVASAVTIKATPRAEAWEVRPARPGAARAVAACWRAQARKVLAARRPVAPTTELLPMAAVPAAPALRAPEAVEWRGLVAVQPAVLAMAVWGAGLRRPLAGLATGAVQVQAVAAAAAPYPARAAWKGEHQAGASEPAIAALHLAAVWEPAVAALHPAAVQERAVAAETLMASPMAVELSVMGAAWMERVAAREEVGWQVIRAVPRTKVVPEAAWVDAAVSAGVSAPASAPVPWALGTAVRACPRQILVSERVHSLAPRCARARSTLIPPVGRQMRGEHSRQGPI